MRTWVVVADASRARLFEKNALSPLTELQTFVHLESRQSNSTAADEHGRVFENERPRHYIEPKNSVSQHEEHIFAHELGRFLDSAEADHRFDHLVLIAPPAFLGALRERIEARTQKHIAGTLNKNLTMEPPKRIARYLKRLH